MIKNKEKIIKKYKKYYDDLKIKFILDTVSMNKIDYYSEKIENQAKKIQIYKYKKEKEINIFNKDNNLLALMIEKNNKLYLKYFCLYHEKNNKLYERKIITNIKDIDINISEKIVIEKKFHYKNNKLFCINYIDLTNNKNLLQEFFTNNINYIKFYFEKKYLYYKFHIEKINEIKNLKIIKKYTKLFQNNKKFNINQIIKFLKIKKVNNKFLNKIEIKNKNWEILLLEYEKNITKSINNTNFIIKNLNINIYSIKKFLVDKNINELKKEFNKIFKKEFEKEFNKDFLNKELLKYIDLKYKNIDKIEIKNIKNIDKTEIIFYKYNNKENNKFFFIKKLLEIKKIIYNKETNFYTKKYKLYNKENQKIKETIINNNNLNNIIIKNIKYNKENKINKIQQWIYSIEGKFKKSKILKF